MGLLAHGAGWLWFLVLAATVCMGAAIIYGSAIWRRRRTDPAIREVRDAVTREHYKSSEGQRP
jgi:hypothetical protein